MTKKFWKVAGVVEILVGAGALLLGQEPILATLCILGGFFTLFF